MMMKDTRCPYRINLPRVASKPSPKSARFILLWLRVMSEHSEGILKHYLHKKGLWLLKNGLFLDENVMHRTRIGYVQLLVLIEGYSVRHVIHGKQSFSADSKHAIDLEYLSVPSHSFVMPSYI